MFGLSLLLVVSAAPKCLTVAEAEAAIGTPTDLGAKFTPLLPVTWPPSATPAVHSFDFRSQALLTGVVSYSLESPSTEVTIPLDGSPARRRSLGKRTKLGNFGARTDQPRVDLAPASAVLLTVLCENRMPTEAEAAKLREGYGAWLNNEPLMRTWLASPFVAWLSAQPLPPPAPAGVKLTARLEGSSIVLNRDGKEARLERAGFDKAQLTVVPLRADGNEPALWVNYVDVQSGPSSVLVRFASPPQVVYSLTRHSGRLGMTSTTRTAWLLDLDGDGFNDLAEHSTTRSDVGMEGNGALVFRYDPFLGSYVNDGKLDKRAPWAELDRDTRPQKLISAALKVPQVELRGRLDLFTIAQPSAPQVDTIGGGSSPPFVGPDVIYRVLTRKPGEKLGGRYHLAHLRYGKEPKLISIIELGPLAFPMNMTDCKVTEEFRREGSTIVISWPPNQTSFVEQRIAWDGKNLIKPPKPPTKIADCDL